MISSCSPSASPSTGEAERALHAIRLDFWRKICLMAILSIVTVLVCLYSSFIGVTDVHLAQIIHRFIPIWPLGDYPPLSDSQWVAFSLIRLPRIAISIFAGAALACSGAIMQVITANDLASPFTTGIANAAACGASLAILSGISLFSSFQLATILLACIMAGLCSIAVFAIASIRQMGRQTIVLTGIAFSYLFAAISAAMQFIADERELSSIVSWTFGNVGAASWPQIWILASAVAICSAIAMVNADRYTLISTGEDAARGMGVDVVSLRRLSAIMITILASITVSFTGVIGFVGLVAPHLARMTVGHHYRYTLPTSLIMGALLVVSADTIGRTIVSPAIIPVGIVVSIIGIPFFIGLIIHRQDH